jgi:hypothetical protein
MPNNWDPFVDPYRTSAGFFVSLNQDGTTHSEEAFPVPSYNRKILLTKTHCFFGSVPSVQFFLTAKLETPQDYFELAFSRDEIILPGSGINYIFDPLLILPSGRHLLCTKDVWRSFVGAARRRGLSLSTLGVVELPFRVG